MKKQALLLALLLSSSVSAGDATIVSSTANAVRVKRGALAAGEDGMVLVGGASAASLPVSFLPPGTGDYKAGSHLLALSPDLTDRVVCTRFQPGGETRAIAVRTVGEKRVIVAGGVTSEKRAGEFHVAHAVQPEGAPGCGFLTVLIVK